MIHRNTPTRPRGRRVRRGLALVLAMFAAACGSEAVAPDLPAQPTAQPTPIPTWSPIAPSGGTSSIEGRYQLTITASPSCALPAEFMQRTYTASVAEATAGHVTVTLSDADFSLAANWGQAGFEGTRDGDHLRFVIDNAYGSTYYFIERIEGTKNLVYEGLVDAANRDNRIAGFFFGRISYSATVPTPQHGQCAASNHQFVLER